MHLKQWALELQDWKESGLTQTQWCALSGVNIHTFKSHIKEVKKELIRIEKAGDIEASSELSVAVQKQPVFAELQMPRAYSDNLQNEISMRLDLPHARIDITKEACSEQIRTVLEVLKYA